MAGIDQLEALVASWLALDRCVETRGEIERLVDRRASDELRRRMAPRIAFGTAGLRAAMGAGYAHMNELVVVQTTQGLAEHLIATDPDVRARGVVIGHDHRHRSATFARLAAGVLLHRGVPVHHYGCVVATPLVPFAVTLLNASAGVMITASHNPKDDNGYKLYASNGAQIIPPTDADVQARILAHLEPQSWDYDAVDTHPLAHRLDLPQGGNDLIVEYLAYMRLNLRFTLATPRADAALIPRPAIAYTAMHGVGHRFVQRAFVAFGLDPPSAVEEQCTPDPDFPTVKFPNPEEGKGALQLAIAHAERVGASLILANDPDADRLAVAERDPARGEWHVFNGNEVGALLGWFLLEQPARSAKRAMLASAVSSRMLATICAAAEPPVLFRETLTGFKWLGNVALQLEAEGYEVLFAFEEAIGYMTDPRVKDKDGISAAVTMAHLANYVADQGRTLLQMLHELYTRHGYFAINNSYFVSPEPAVTAAIFERLRHFPGGVAMADGFTYPAGCGPFAVASVRDVTRGFDSDTGAQSTLPVDASSNFVALRFANGATVSLRASGTEPKVKYYAELRGAPDQPRAAVERELQRVVDAVVQTVLEPDRHGLRARAV